MTSSPLSVVMYDPGNFTPYYVDGLCRGLADLGLGARVLASPALFEAVDPAGRYEIEQVFYSRLTGRLAEFLRGHHRLRRLLKAASYPLGVWRSGLLLRGRPAGVLHVQWALVPPLDAWLARSLRARGWRIVYTIHDLLPGQDQNRASRWHRPLLRAADAVIVHADTLAEKITRTYPELAARVHVIPHGGALGALPGPDERLLARQWLGLGARSPVLLFFGMIKPYKGLEYLIEALPGVLAARPDARLVIAGEPLMPLAPIERMIARLGVGHAIVWHPGFVPAAEVPRYFAAADLVVAPHVGQVGVSGVVVLSQAWGLPVVTTEVGGLPELVLPDDCGWVVAPRAATALAEAIRHALADPERLAEMGRRARSRIARETDWREVARRTTALYQRCLAAGSEPYDRRR